MAPAIIQPELEIEILNNYSNVLCEEELSLSFWVFSQESGSAEITDFQKT